MQAMGCRLGNKDRWKKIREIVQNYNLHLLDTRITAFLFDEVVISENAIDPIGDARIRIPINKPVKTVTDAPIPAKKIDSDKLSIKKTDRPAISPPVLTDLSDRVTEVALSSVKSVPQQSRTMDGLKSYRIQNLVADGISFQSARQLINVSSIIEADIRNGQFGQAEEKLMGLHPDFATKVMLQNPWIMVFMLELMPEWWKGQELLELAKKARISEAVREMVRKQIKTVTSTTEVSDKNPFRKKSDTDILWRILNKKRLFDSLEQKFRDGDITESQYREVYNSLIVGDLVSLDRLSANQKQLLFGKRDEIPIVNGIKIENGLIKGEVFVGASFRPDGEGYRRFLKNLLAEHPREVSVLIDESYPLFKDELSAKTGISIGLNLNESRGGLAVVAEELFKSDINDETVGFISDNILRTEMLEAIFTSNMERSSISDSIDNVLKEVDFEVGEQVVLGFFKKYYVQGDESTDRFRQSLKLVQKFMRQSDRFKEDITNIAIKLCKVDRGNFLYALMRLAPKSGFGSGFRLPIVKKDRTLTGNRLIEYSL